MKLTKLELIKIIKEELDKSISEGHRGEGSMARSQLARTAELAAMLGDMITDESNLEEWVESKITKAQDYLTTVMNYMRGSELTDESKDFLKENLGGIKYLEEELTEAYSEKQRKWACAQMGKSRKNFKGKKKLSKKEAEEMCKSEVEEK